MMPTSNVVYISVIDSQAQIVATGSVYNDNNCRLVLNLVEELLQEVNDGTIAILGCYQAQYRCYSSGLAKMAREIDTCKDRVITDKIDRRQGSEFDIVRAAIFPWHRMLQVCGRIPGAPFGTRLTTFVACLLNHLSGIQFF